MESDTEEVRVWLVERGYNNRDLLILKYATPDGTQRYRRELAPQVLKMGSVTAAKDVSESNLEAVDDPDIRERYESEVARMIEEHDPEDTI